MVRIARRMNDCGETGGTGKKGGTKNMTYLSMTTAGVWLAIVKEGELAEALKLVDFWGERLSRLKG